MKRFGINFIIIAAAMYGCSGVPQKNNHHYESLDFVYYEVPVDWSDEEIRAETIEFYSQYLEGVKIFLDPGHGGEDRKNRSLSGKIVEADVNLRVALYLREYLEDAGADVLMSRESDETIDLESRSQMANESDADIFISIHHNAPGNDIDYWSNYTSAYYHGIDGEYEFEPFEKRLAMYIERDLAYVMRNSGGLGSFDGTYSDYIIYPGEGFSVLRETKIPAVLIECAFHTSRLEERRLAIPAFNQIQAWGIFRGIGKFFAAGFPVVSLLQDESSFSGGTLNLTLALKDTAGIDSKSIIVYFDSVEIDYSFDKLNSFLSIGIENVEAGEHVLRVICANKSGNYCYPWKRKIITRSKEKYSF